MNLRILILFVTFVFPQIFILSMAEAMFFEIGTNYAYKKTTIDSLNTSEQQGATGSLSIYIWEQVAIELSYTNSLYVKKEQNLSSVNPSVRITTQVADIYGIDLIYVLSTRKAALQPFLKGGAGYIVKHQTTQIDNTAPWTVGPYNGTALSAGVGFKFFLTDAVAIKASYDIISTPIDNSNTAQDINGRFGLSWMF